jgi:ribosome-binding protein aMBF1 (putative translation factor)
MKTKKIDINKLKTFEELTSEWLKDPEFRKEYEALQPEYQLACQMMDARIAKKMSQKELAKRAGTGQAVISRLEGMNARPSFSLVQKIATALKTNLTFTFTAN